MTIRYNVITYKQYLPGHLFAGSDFTEPRLLHRFTLWIAVVYPGGHSSPAGFGAG